MEMYIFRHSEVERLYNCSTINIDDVPLERRKHVVEGTIAFVLCAIYYVMYVPCMISIYRHSANTCYRILFYISIADCLILWQLGFVVGILSIQGAVYCHYPNFLYFIGMGVTSIWAAETVAESILAINRCMFILNPDLEKKVFGGRKTDVWLTITTLYAIYWVFFMKPAMFTSIYVTFYFNPWAGYRDDVNGTYHSVLHSIHDTTDAILVPLIYGLFFVFFYLKMKRMGASKNIFEQKMMFLQIFVISLFNFSGCANYVLLCYVEASDFLIHLAQWGWFHVHGAPPVIYLLLNKTIRNDCKQLFRHIRGKHSGSTIKKFFTTQVAPTSASLPSGAPTA